VRSEGASPLAKDEGSKLAGIRIPDLIDRKRRGESLGRAELEALVLGYTRGEVPDYQVSAWLMAVCWRGMPPDEVADLTDVMADSGRRLDLSSLGCLVADKHSTGGVGDKTSLVAAPLVAACGVPVAKMSGRGLGFSGGTLDKLEAIPGLRVELSSAELIDQVARERLAIVGQSPELAPADGKLYALRDVTATVESIPLIASSIMSKKLAAGADVIVLDVKVGSGAFMPTLAEARELAELMVAIGQANGRRTAAYVTDMSQPLGLTVGNALEVAEAIASLRGAGPPDLAALATALAGEVLFRCGAAADRTAGQAAAEVARRNGAGLERLAAMVRAQAGDARYVEEPERLPAAPLRRALVAPRSGVVQHLDARLVAQAALALGAGRERKGDLVDPAVGVELAVKIGAQVAVGDRLATLHAADPDRLGRAETVLREAFELGDQAIAVPDLIHWRSA
jgi:pyrimidine-nucleoside phosphorylase